MGLYLGLMSGTSADSIDAALVAIEGMRPPNLLAARSHPLSDAVKTRVFACFSAEPLPPACLGGLDALLGRLFAEAAMTLLAEAGVDAGAVTAIGSHGQTVFHAPDADPPFSMQLGDPNVIAETTGITTVADFRRRDIAAGGQGAPLVPAFHAHALRSSSERRVVLNLGGIANVSVLPRSDEAAPVTGFDTGPANGLLDAWTRRCTGAAMDEGGSWARGGVVNGRLLERLLDDPWFDRSPPKSTGREHFGLGWLQARLDGDARQDEDVARTLTEFTARSVAEAIARWAPGTATVLACGGGTRNTLLMERLSARLAPVALDTTDAEGVPAQWIEAMAFAWLAHETLAGRPGNLPSVTGARREAVLGAIHPGWRHERREQ